MARFYGWSHEYIMQMPYRTAMEYFVAITVIEAQDFLVDLNLADYPSMRKDSRSKVYREAKKKAYPKGLQKEMSFEDFARKMNGGRKNSN